MMKTVRIATAVIKDDIVTRINLNNYSNYKRLLRVTARVLLMYHTDPKPTFFNVKGAVYLDLTADYSTEKFLMVLRRFVSLRGYPFKLYSNNGPQLVAANKELQSVTKGWDWEELKAFGNMEGFQWEFTTADGPWQNRVSEALVKSVKRAIAATIHESILTFSELQTVLFEIAF